MKVLIVTEAGKKIGFGHMMRCLSIDQAFRRQSIKPRFIVNGGQEVRKILSDKEYRLLDWLTKRKELLKEISGADIVLVDSYLADRPLYQKMAAVVKLMVYIDDNKRLDYPQGVVINTMVYANELAYPKREGIDYLLGPHYAHVRREFLRIPKRPLRRSLKTILVTLGGSDFLNLTPKILEILARRFPQMKKQVIIGSFYTNDKAIKQASDANTKITINANGALMKKLILDADIAITGAGQTIIELARVGLPALCLCVADNQRRHLHKWSEYGFVGLSNPRSVTELEGAILNTIKQFSSMRIRQNFRSQITKIINPQGSDRIVQELIKKLRVAKKVKQ